MRHYKHLYSRCSLLGALLLVGVAPAALADYYTTTANQGGSPGTSWASSIIWQLNGTGTAVAAAPGNTYEALSNGVALGSGTATTLLRNPYSAGTPNIAVFPGDSLILDTNTQIRFKGLSTSGASAEGLSYSVPTNSFPGSNGLAGLVLKGGALNTGDDAHAYTILGTIQAFPGTLSYLDPADSLNGSATSKRGLIIAAQLSGSGTLAVLNAQPSIPQQILGASNTFTGQWIIKAGWLQGAGDGASDGYNSLGTNVACSYVVDPQWTPPDIFDAGAGFIAGPAILDMGPSLANCGGTLQLTNGGQLRLSGNVVFSAVTIEGTPLAKGTHTAAELVAAYPTSFTAGSVGTVTVQPFGVPPVLQPVITANPSSLVLYSGRTARFSVTAVGGAGGLSYRWRKDTVDLNDGGNIAGSTNSTLTLTGVSATDIGSYDVKVSSAGGSVMSTAASLGIATPTGESYQSAVLTANPVAFYQLNETTDPSTNPPAYDYVGGFNGTYGTAVQNGFNHIAGPTATDGLSGFNNGNAAALFTHGIGDSRIPVVPWNLNTTNVTITAWIKPSTTEAPQNGLVFCRGSGTVAGLDYGGTPNAATSSYNLGYHWNDEAGTYNWDSGITAPQDQWSFVTLVVTPTNAAIYVLNTNGLTAAIHTYVHVPQAFGGITTLGDDDYDNNNGTRSFDGSMDDVAVFNSAFSMSQVVNLYAAASGVSNFPPTIAQQPVSQTVYQRSTLQLSGLGASLYPLTYQWRSGVTGSGVYANVVDGGRISGATNTTLTISNVALSDARDYILVVSDSTGSATSAVATITVTPTGPPINDTFTGVEPTGTDWENGTYWASGNPASFTAANNPGSTFEVLPGSRFRSPAAVSLTNFPGAMLTIDGDGVWTDATSVTPANVAELRFKHASPGTVIFPHLVMNGGQIDNGDDGLIIIGGWMEILSNAPIYVTTDATADRSYQIDAWLTGSASIEYHSAVGDLNITGTSNTYSGTWNIVQGTLLGSGPGSLGTNNIVIGAAGSVAGLETLYDIINPNGSLTVDAGSQVFLHQNDTFKAVTIGGVSLAPGLYTFTQLTNAYPTNFPASWPPQRGSSVTTGSGSITVGNVTPPPATVTLYVQMAGTNLQLSWSQGTLLEATNVSGPWVQVNGAASPYHVTPSRPQTFYRVQVR